MAVPSASAWSHRTLCKVSLGLVSTQLPVQGINESVVPRKRFILEPGSCSRRCSTAAINPASAGGACAGTQTWGGQTDDVKEGRVLGLAGRSSSQRSAEESDAGPACLPDLTESGSGRRLESRASRTRNAARRLGARQGFVEFGSCNVARTKVCSAAGQTSPNGLRPRNCFGPGRYSRPCVGERRGQCLVQCLIGRLAEKISASGRRDPRSRKARASLLPITAAQTSLHLPQTATSVVRQLSTARTEKRGLTHPRPGRALRIGAGLTSWLSSPSS